MPHYLRIRDLPTDFDWRHKGKGRRVQCPKCGLGVTMYITALEAACTRCRCECEVLTETPRGATAPRQKSPLERPRQSPDAQSGTEGASAPEEAA